MPNKDGPWRITFDTNPDDCNLKCIMCEGFSEYSEAKNDRIQANLKRRRMDIRLLEKIVIEAKKFGLREIIPSTMGEPLLYKDFEKIIELCVKHDLRLNLTTNGTFPRKNVLQWAEMLVPITSDIKISWNGAKAETQEKIMIGSRWEIVLDNVKKLISYRNSYQGRNYCSVTLQLTFLETNVNELADIVDLAIDLGVDRVKGHHLWAHFPQIKTLSMRRNHSSIERWNSAVDEAFTVVKKRKLPSGKDIILENFTKMGFQGIVDLDPEAECPFLGKEVWVSAEGRFNPCCAPDKERMKLGEFGNLNEKGLMEIWNDSPYINLKKNYKNNPLCIGCNMRKRNHA